MPSQQSGLRGRRTALIPHLFIARMLRSLVGPSKNPKPSAQTYSEPLGLTPRSLVGFPAASTRWSPDTLSSRAEAVRGDKTAPRHSPSATIRRNHVISEQTLRSP